MIETGNTSAKTTEEKKPSDMRTIIQGCVETYLRVKKNPQSDDVLNAVVEILVKFGEETKRKNSFTYTTTDISFLQHLVKDIFAVKVNPIKRVSLEISVLTEYLKYTMSDMNNAEQMVNVLGDRLLNGVQVIPINLFGSNDEEVVDAEYDL